MLANAIKQEKTIRLVRTGKEEANSLFIIAYLEKTEESMEKYYKPWDNKVAGHKISVVKLLAFVKINYKPFEDTREGKTLYTIIKF